MYSATLTWGKCGGSSWCNLLTVDLNHPYFSNIEGVYVIWHAGQTPETVYVGQGAIADRLRMHRTDPRILKYGIYGLFVTWAKADAFSRDGIERYLIEALRPKETARSPQVPPIQANLPW